jgi:hypothetical protein
MYVGSELGSQTLVSDGPEITIQDQAKGLPGKSGVRVFHFISAFSDYKQRFPQTDAVSVSCPMWKNALFDCFSVI